MSIWLALTLIVILGMAWAVVRDLRKHDRYAGTRLAVNEWEKWYGGSHS